MTTRRLLGAALAALLLLPGAAQAAALTPLKPCYISVTQPTPVEPTRSRASALDLAGSGFTPGALVDLELRRQARRARSRPTRPATCRRRSSSRPTGRSGQGTFTLTAAEQGNPANTVALPSRTTALDAQHPPVDGRAVDAACASAARGFTAAEGGLGALPLQGQGAQDRAARAADRQPLRDVLGPPPPDPDQAARSSGSGAAGRPAAALQPRAGRRRSCASTSTSSGCSRSTR